MHNMLRSSKSLIGSDMNHINMELLSYFNEHATFFHRENFFFLKIEIDTFSFICKKLMFNDRGETKSQYFSNLT